MLNNNFNRTQRSTRHCRIMDKNNTLLNTIIICKFQHILSIILIKAQSVLCKTRIADRHVGDGCSSTHSSPSVCLRSMEHQA